MAKQNQKAIKRDVRRKRIRAKVSGTKDMPRVSIFKSNKFIYAQVIDDQKGVTIASISSAEAKGNKSAKKSDSKTDSAKAAGVALAKEAISKGIKAVVFDRGGYIYTGRIKAFADALREGGLKF